MACCSACHTDFGSLGSRFEDAADHAGIGDRDMDRPDLVLASLVRRFPDPLEVVLIDLLGCFTAVVGLGVFVARSRHVYDALVSVAEASGASGGGASGGGASGAGESGAGESGGGVITAAGAFGEAPGAGGADRDVLWADENV